MNQNYKNKMYVLSLYLYHKYPRYHLGTVWFLLQEAADNSDVDSCDYDDSNSDLDDECTKSGTHTIHDNISEYCTKVPKAGLYKCNDCVFTHRYPSKVRRHFYYRHCKYCPYRCASCDFESVESDKVKRHCQLIHPDTPITVIKRSIKPLATNELQTESIMQNSHYTEDIEIEEEAVEEAENWWTQYVIKKSNNRHECNICGYSQEGVAPLKRHLMAIHFKFHPYTCKYCDYTHIELNRMKRHSDKHHPGNSYHVLKRKITDAFMEAVSITSEMLGGIRKQKSSPLGMNLPTRTLRREQVDDVVRVKSEPHDLSYGDMESHSREQSPANILSISSVRSLSRSQVPETAPPMLLAALQKKKAAPAPLHVEKKKKKPPARCMYCGYTSQWNIKDVKLHIYRVHQRKLPFMCGFCRFGNVIREKVKNHVKTFHPAMQMSIRDERKGLDNIVPLEEKEDEYMLVGIVGEDGLPVPQEDVHQAAPNAPSRGGVGRRIPSRASPRSSLNTPPKSVSQVPSTTNTPLQALRQVLDIPMTNHVQTMQTTVQPIQKQAAKVKGKTSSKHQTDKWYLCKVCQHYGTHQLDNLLYHILAKHQRQKPYKCRHCDLGKWRRGDFHDHVAENHPGMEQSVLYMIAERRRELLQFVSLAPKVPSEVPEEKPPPPPPAKSAIIPLKKKTIAANWIKPSAALKLRCEICNNNYSSAKVLWAHKRTHYTYRPFGCSYCKFKAFNSTPVEQHMAKHHPAFPMTVMKIPKPTVLELDPMDHRIAASSSSPLEQMQSPPRVDMSPAHHLSPISSPPLMADREPQFTPPGEMLGMAMSCAHCGVVRPHQHSMEIHQAKAHPTKPSSYTLVQTSPGDANVATKEGFTPRVSPVEAAGLYMYSCKHCSFTSKLPTVMRHHAMSHMNYKPYACSYCKFRSVRPYSVKCHLQKMHSELPGKIIRQKSNQDEDFLHNSYSRFPLKQGAQANLAESFVESEVDDNDHYIFSCLSCAYTSKNSTVIRHHVMVHLGYKPYSCGYCKFQSVRPYDVKIHSQKMHPGFPPKTIHRKNNEYEILLRDGFTRHMQDQAMHNVRNMLQNDRPTMARMPNIRSPPAQQPIFPKRAATSTRQESSPLQKQIKLEPVDDGYERAAVPARQKPKQEPSLPRCKPSPKRKSHFKCIQCGVSKVSRIDLERHMMWEIGYKPHACPYCTYNQVLMGDVKRHIIKKHKDKPVRILKLSNTTKEAKLKDLVDKSTILLPPGVDRPLPERKPTEKTKTLRSPPATKIKQEPVDKVEQEAKVRSVALKSTSGRLIVPPRRHSVYENSDPLGSKLTTECGSKRGKLHQCTLCGLVCVLRKSMYNHLVRHGEKRLQCSYCDVQGYFPNEVIKHITVRHQGLPVEYIKLKTAPLPALSSVVKYVTQEEVDQQKAAEMADRNPKSVKDAETTPEEKDEEPAAVATPSTSRTGELKLRIKLDKLKKPLAAAVNTLQPKPSKFHNFFLV